jgi:hypothetical protein
MPRVWPIVGAGSGSLLFLRMSFIDVQFVMLAIVFTITWAIGVSSLRSYFGHRYTKIGDWTDFKTKL